MADNGVKNESDKDSGGKQRVRGPDNPGYSNKDGGGGDAVGGGIAGGGSASLAFAEEKHIFNNQTIKQKAPKITKKEVKYAKPPHVAADDAKKLSDVREKFAKNADKPTTASDNDGKKLPEIMQNVDPQQLMQMLPQMFKKMSKVRDQMNMMIPSATKNIFQDAFTGALKILVSRYGYDEVVFVFNRTFGAEGFDKIIPSYQSIVRNAFVDLVTEAVFQGPNSIKISEFETVRYGTIIPIPVVEKTEVPDLYVKVYYPVDEDPHPGYIEWESPDGKKSVYVRRGEYDYPASSASEEAFNTAEIGVANDLSPYIIDGFEEDPTRLKILTVDDINKILEKQMENLLENGQNNTQGNNTGNNNGGGGGGGGNQIQQLLGKLQPLVEKFQTQMLGQQGGGGTKLTAGLGLGVETILDVMKNKDALEKFTKNMGNLNGMEKNAEGAFSMFNQNGLQNLQGQLGQFMNQGGGGGGGGGGGNQNQGGGQSSQQPQLSYNQLSNSASLLNKLNTTTSTT